MTVENTNPTANPTAGQAPAGGANQGQAPTNPANEGQAPNEQLLAQLDKVEKLPAWAQKLVTDLRNENAEHRTKLTDAEKAKADAEQAKLKEQGNWQQLAEQATKKAEELEKRIAEGERRDLLRSVADKYKLPAELAERLRGTTQAELEKDAESLAKLIPAAPPARAGNSPNPAPAGNNNPSEKIVIQTELRQKGGYGSM